MKIIAISDTHMIKPLHELNLPSGDVLIIAGDILKSGSFGEFYIVLNELNKIKYKYKNIIVVAGNHDVCFQELAITKMILLEDDIVYLEDMEVVIDGVKFYGTPWSKPFNNWAFMADEKRREKKFNNIPKDVDVLITHAPPYQILDKTSKGEEVGCEILKKMLDEDEIAPKYIICGHIHQDKPEPVKYKNTVIYNGSLCNELYQLVNYPSSIKILKN